MRKSRKGGVGVDEDEEGRKRLLGRSGLRGRRRGTEVAGRRWRGQVRGTCRISPITDCATAVF